MAPSRVVVWLPIAVAVALIVLLAVGGSRGLVEAADSGHERGEMSTQIHQLDQIPGLSAPGLGRTALPYSRWDCGLFALNAWFSGDGYWKTFYDCRGGGFDNHRYATTDLHTNLTDRPDGYDSKG